LPGDLQSFPFFFVLGRRSDSLFGFGFLSFFFFSPFLLFSRAGVESCIGFDVGFCVFLPFSSRRGSCCNTCLQGFFFFFSRHLGESELLGIFFSFFSTWVRSDCVDLSPFFFWRAAVVAALPLFSLFVAFAGGMTRRFLKRPLPFCGERDLVSREKQLFISLSCTQLSQRYRFPFFFFPPFSL